MTRFQKDTAITRLGDGRFRARLDGGWWIVRGPNGGYLTGILVRAIQAEVNDPERLPRSLTIHFLAAASEGMVDIEVRIERLGGSLATVEARILQEGRLIAVALGALSKARPRFELKSARMPEVPPPEQIERSERLIPISGRFDLRFLPETDSLSETGVPTLAGWIRLDETQALDYPLLGTYTDALPPALFSMLGDSSPIGMPTIDLTIHFHENLPRPQDKPDDYCLAIIRAGISHEGFITEDAEIWSRDGQLLASARQLAAIVRA